MYLFKFGKSFLKVDSFPFECWIGLRQLAHLSLDTANIMRHCTTNAIYNPDIWVQQFQEDLQKHEILHIAAQILQYMCDEQVRHEKCIFL